MSGVKSEVAITAEKKEITQQIKEEARAGILDQIRVIRDKANNKSATYEARTNLEALLRVEDYFRGIV